MPASIRRWALPGAEGATGHFRQTYERTADDQMGTSVKRETEHGRVAAFPGSDHLATARRTS